MEWHFKSAQSITSFIFAKSVFIKDQYFYEPLKVIFVYITDSILDSLYSQARKKSDAFPVPKWQTLKRQIKRYININNSRHLTRKYARIFVRGHYLFRERSSRKTVSFEEQVMSKDKYRSIFSKSNGGCCVYCPLNIVCNTRCFENWGIFSEISQFQLGFTWRV